MELMKGITPKEMPREGVWCDHVGIIGCKMDGASFLSILPSVKAVFVLIEEGKVKLVCLECLQRGLRFRVV